MFHKSHLSQQELLLFTDGELSARHADRARLHLSGCAPCRERMEQLHNAIVTFTQLQMEAFRRTVPPESSRADLQSRISEMSDSERCSSVHAWLFPLRGSILQAAAVGFSVVLFTAVVSFVANRGLHESVAGALHAVDGRNSPIPDRRLTPGATRPVSVADICMAQPSDANGAVPEILQEKVFREYGIADAQSQNYELDYLVTPELGGSEDPRNLWPEPHASTEWNSYVKDRLESRLHELVCNGKVDLVTAQRDIETDWIAAYKKYVGTSVPMPLRSDEVLHSGSGPNG